MITYRNIDERDITGFWDFLNTLDEETLYMMYEAGERKWRTSIKELEGDIKSNVFNGEDCVLIAENDSEIAGYIRAERGRFNRVRHTAYVVVGILKKYRGKGIGTIFFRYLDKWATDNNIMRLELTVECQNEAAIHLYEKSGFNIEGTRKCSMCVNGEYVDEYYMSKIL